MSDKTRTYLWITLAYWAFTITDGAIRMLVVLHFYQLGFPPLQIAMLFLFYEFFGIITNLVGGGYGPEFGTFLICYLFDFICFGSGAGLRDEVDVAPFL